MTATSLSLIVILLYLIAWTLILIRVRATVIKIETPLSQTKVHFLAWFAALIMHIVALHFPLMMGKPLAFSFFSLGSYVMWFISLALFITTVKRKMESLAIVILPLTIISIALPPLLGIDSEVSINMKSGLGLHILTSLLAYSFLMLASFQALLVSAQNTRLHRHKTTAFTRSLPSLEDMEHLLFRFIAIGVFILSISLLSGFFYLDNFFGNHLAHKTILSILSWVIFSALLIGRWKYGWRGKKAIRWTLAGFILLMLGFFGTKFVQEFVL